jgi:proteic killer suppression protein
MIRTFADKTTQAIWSRETVKRYRMDILIKARRKLGFINDAEDLNDLLIPPSNKLRKMKGKYKEFYRINVDQQYRIVFKWIDGDAYDVEFTDNHDDL